MTNPIDDQWDIINPPVQTTSTMAPTPEQSSVSAPAAEPVSEVTINIKPAENGAPKDEAPKLQRHNSSDSFISTSDDEPDERRRPRPVRTRRDSFSPAPIRRGPSPLAPMLSSSTHLLERVNYDGIVEFQWPGRNTYMATFPFTDRDVKKWSWLFAHGVEETFLTPGGKLARDDGADDDYFSGDEYLDGGRYGARVVRNRGRSWDACDTSAIYLSRALDTAIIPEDTKDVKYFIVVKDGKHAGGAKLVTAESRKAAGILLYYEALSGNSIVFVGAAVGAVGKKAKKFKRAEGVEEAKVMREKGVVGIIC